MTVRNKLFTVLSSFLMVFAVGTFALAQETTTKQEDSSKQDTQKVEKGFGHRGGHGKGGRHGFGKGFGHGGMRGGMRGGFHKLNLSEDQKTQLKTLHESFRASNKTTFDEMHTLFQQKHDKTITADGEARIKVLGEQMKAAHEQLRATSMNLLTAEQKTQLETLKAERKLKMEERRKMRQSRPDTTVPQTKENSL
ncbi:MAG TPA: Spy/CpxP family protein refolding chaperone [Pyrinomonadaceae bacterium]|jgi:Spy/CpxP family protein refolding chaperone|nr:Spy/CpxP family protein refolding chaperone [Pyrinomonadaceae bacterium]